MAKDDSRLSPPTVLRLSEYLLILEQYIKENKEIISSRELADAYGNNANQVRQDIFHLENSVAWARATLPGSLLKRFVVHLV